MRKTKVLTLLLSVALTMGLVLTGCGGANSDESNGNTSSTKENAGKTAVDISKKVELNMYLIGSPAKDYDMVLAEVNKKLEKDINATVKVNWVGWADFGTQYPLLLASGEPIDLIYASTWTNFYSNARKGAFLAIEDLAKQYAPKSLAQITPDAYKQTEVDGHLYAMPAQFFQYGDMGYIVRGDLMDKYGLKTIENLDDYGKYLDAVVKNDSQLDPSGQISSSGGLESYYANANGYYNILATQYSPFMVSMDDASAKIVNLYETDGISDYYKKMKEWGDNKYWSKSILSNKDDKMFENGKAASNLHNQDSWKGAYMKHPDWDVRFFPNSKYTYKTSAMQDGMAIPASAANPERALMFLELLRTDQSYYNLLTYGIEGKHYEITADNKLKALDLDGFAPEGYCSWGFKSPEFYKEPVDSPPNIDEVRKQLSDRALDNPYALFTPDFEPVKNEMAALNNVVQQYALPLNYGYIKDPAEGLKTLVDKIKNAGSDKIIAEMQKQLDAFLAANKTS
ncbi:ABC transporter substrate-binding protein [Paenibacillus sp. CF384]|uniref:ABC transporter substrate-binding protein n=1 Tax=Paenibacillus sp. CF384 TaxID=1884382 RepID=UPI0008958E4B|nr:ABC transporter substrate-binding protein [Paenibacillus sp. CF384]SDX99824.1 putative aldouronate transport system substrate-binding protein [Paenibacillus sp. CF384]